MFRNAEKIRKYSGVLLLPIARSDAASRLYRISARLPAQIVMI